MTFRRWPKAGGRNVFGFLLRLAAAHPLSFIAGRLYGPEALGRFAYAILIVEFVAQLATLGFAGADWRSFYHKVSVPLRSGGGRNVLRHARLGLRCCVLNRYSAHHVSQQRDQRA